MKILDPNIETLFNIESDEDFERKSLEVFQYQYHNNSVYQRFVDLLKVNPNSVESLASIPFLPISFFKSHTLNLKENHQAVFKSSGTTGQARSQHFVADLSVYEKSFSFGFQSLYGDINSFAVLALLPSYLEQGDSSLVYMAKSFVEKTRSLGSDFFLHDFERLNHSIEKLEAQGQAYIILGVSYALLDFLEKFPQQLTCGFIMETGGMKGRRKELTKKELHSVLSQNSGGGLIHSEYGMTELLSQAYSKGEGIYKSPSWMKVVTRSTTDPLTLVQNQRGLLNIIDLANVNSCSFIATEDLGFVHQDGSFEVLGRFDTSEIRGCNLMVE